MTTTDRKAFALLALLLAVTGPGCIIGFDGSRGSGDVVSELREVDDFDAVSIDGLAKATVIVGAEKKVRVRGDDNLIGFVRTRVSRGRLQVDVDPVFATDSEPLSVTIYTPELTSLELGGAVATKVSGLDGGDLDLVASGATHVSLDGNVACFGAELTGASSLDGADFSAQCADLSASGASTIELAVSESLRVSLNGASSLVVHGTPRILSQEVDGASHLDIGD